MGSSFSTLPEVQSVEVATASPPQGEGRPRRHSQQPLPTACKYDASIDNLYLLFASAAARFSTNACMGERSRLPSGARGPFEWLTFAESLAKIDHLGAGLAGLGLRAGEAYGIYAMNCPQWAWAAFAGWRAGGTLVPVYDTLGDNILQYEANHADMTLIFIEKRKLATLLSVLHECPTIKYIVQLEPLDGEKPSLPAGVSLTDLPSLCAAGAAAPVAAAPAKGSELAIIMYTSGTTGDPKGVCLTHNSIVVGASYSAGIGLLPSDSYLSYLPLAHIFETVVEHGIWSHGGRIGFFSGDIKKLLDDVAALAPTLFVGVPRVYQRVYDKGIAGITAKSPKVASLLLWALEKELAAVRVGQHTMWNLLFTKIFRKVMGGNVRLMISGAAPLPTHVHEFLHATMGCPVVQGYGMTESCAMGTLQHMADFKAGSVGPPIPVIEIKLKDVPEMNYTSDKTPPCGEVAMRGPTIFSRYHKNPSATAETIDSDGWLLTGDIGRWNADGSLSIIDRKKNIFKLAQGEYVAAEKIEMILAKSAYIGQVWVYGNSYFTTLVAVIVPDFEALLLLAAAKGWKTDDKAALATSAEVKDLIKGEIKKYAEEAKLKSFEIPKDFICEGNVNELAQGFTIENDCLTPTFKLKRPQLLKRYQEQVNALYTGLGEDVSKQK